MQVTCQRCGWQGENAQYCSRCGADLRRAPTAGTMPFPPPLQTPAAEPVRVSLAARPAGFWIRVVAYTIDRFVFFAGLGVLFIVGGAASGGMGGIAERTTANFFGTLLDVAYGIVFHWLWGQTPGKMALRIKVVSMDGGPLSLGQATGRYFATFLSAIILCIGFIMAGIRTDKRALHDLLAGTRVVRL
ncbi:MAG TPA: RDD family protein [Candidatus Bathyarchaeia archaeon]|nr:RDD family protein [Candidatus Bathyarchaeia archaeon]